MFLRMLGNVAKRVYYYPFDAVESRKFPSGLRELDEIKDYSRVRTEMSDHLTTLFTEAMSARPRLIVELGVYLGHSTFVLERVARLCNASFISVDMTDCSGVSSYKDWIFVQRDDIEFSGEFRDFCRKRGIKPEIDVLFIDTSHEFEHTVREIECWFPFLSGNARVIFHDTNLRKVVFRRDGSMGVGYNNRRGVIRALEDYFGKPFDEKRDFVDFGKGWMIRHHSYCYGLTILERVCQKPRKGT